MNNPYLPIPIKVLSVVTETEDKNIKTIALDFLNDEDRKRFSFIPGQFAELSILGKGEAPFGIASSPTETGGLKFSISRIGTVTTALHYLEPGEMLGIRGPLGNGYPLESMKGKDTVAIGGGFGFSTLRALINYMLDDRHRSQFKQITVVYGARNPGMLLYRYELATWSKRDDIRVLVAVDQSDENWTELTGLVPDVVKKEISYRSGAHAIVCGPPMMIKLSLPVLQELGFPPEDIYLSLEMRMKCGLGKCGRCNIGPKFVCQDGPVFSLAELKQLPQEY